MAQHDTPGRPPRTVLEQRIRERRQTFEEFATFAEQFAVEHGEPGTLSVRHLQRLVAGRHPDGRLITQVRPATARLLERIFGTSIGELLSTPVASEAVADSDRELHRMLSASQRVDSAVIQLLTEQLNAIRRLDRQLGAIVAHEEVTTKARQVERLMSYSLSPAVRSQLAGLLSELHTLAGWQALDVGSVSESWLHYEKAKSAAAESGTLSFETHSLAEQAFVLLDVGKFSDAVGMLSRARARADHSCSHIFRAWLAAAHGEALAADRRRSESLKAFDEADDLLPVDSTNFDGPYVALDSTHLARWRGNALARFGDEEAVAVLSSALEQLDPSFIRAETSTHVDLATAFLRLGEVDVARVHASIAGRLAAEIGSARQGRRLRVVFGRST
jgi:tetratricopeptide (TPR) repeat protein